MQQVRVLKSHNGMIQNFGVKNENGKLYCTNKSGAYRELNAQTIPQSKSKQKAILDFCLDNISSLGIVIDNCDRRTPGYDDCVNEHHHMSTLQEKLFTIQ